MYTEHKNTECIKLDVLSVFWQVHRMDTHRYAVLSILNTLFRARHHTVEHRHLMQDLGLTAGEVEQALLHLRARRLIQPSVLRLTLSGLAASAALEADRRNARQVA